jgi:hypothetical protein
MGVESTPIEHPKILSSVSSAEFRGPIYTPKKMAQKTLQEVSTDERDKRYYFIR